LFVYIIVSVMHGRANIRVCSFVY